MPANYAGILSTPGCDLVGLGVGRGWGRPEILTGSQSEARAADPRSTLLGRSREQVGGSWLNSFSVRAN